MNGAPFITFGAGHIGVLVFIAVCSALLVACRRKLHGRDDSRLRQVAAVCLIANEAISWAFGISHGIIRLPFQLCDLEVLLLAWAFWSLRPRVCEAAYFLALAGSLQALLTPDLIYGFPDYWWIKFFLTHGGVVLGAVYLAASGRLGLTLRSVARVWLWATAYVLTAMLLNACFGTNYGYLARKPLRPSVLDYLGPWPYYILAIEALSMVLFLVCYLPFAWAGRKRRPGG